MNFKDKVVLVTGGSSGIGAATAILFAREGADVIIVDRDEAKAKKVEQNCAEVGNKPLVIIADVSNDKDVQRIVQSTIDKYNKLDVLVNCAGIVRMGMILEGNVMEIYDEIMKINVRAIVQLTSLAVPYLIKTKGNIVNMSSVCGFKAKEAVGAYATSKAALNHFSQATALELAPHGVRVNLVSGGPVRTDLLNNAGISTMQYEDMKSDTAMNRISDPQEIADVIAFLASDKAKGITGSNYVSDNGWLLIN